MTKKIFAISMALLLVLLILPGCSAGGAADSAASTSSMEAEMAYDVSATAAPAAPAANAAAGWAEETAEAPAEDRGSADLYGGHKIIATYTLELNTDEFDTQYEYLLSIAEDMGGYVQNGEVWGTKPETYGDSGRSAELTFRIPSGQAEQFLNLAGNAGEVQRRSVSTQDVTLDYYDRETRLEVLRIQLERLESILVETDNLADIIALEQAIADVTLEIEQMTTQLRHYDDLIDYATVYIYLYEEALIAGPAATQTMGQRISEGFRSNLSGVLVFLENSAVWLLSSLPVLLLLALVVLLILLIIRALRKRRGDRPPRGKKNKGGPAFWTPQPPAAQAQEAQGKHKDDAHETK